MATNGMLIDERPIMFLPKLAKALGSCERAIILQQIHWLSNQPHSGKDIDGEHWVWGTYEEWCRDYFTMWTPRTLKMHIRNLEKQGVLISAQLRAHQHDQTKYYRIKYDHQLLADTGMGHDHVPSNEHNNVPSNEHNNVPSNEHNNVPSKEHDHVPSSITESSTKSSAEKALTPQQAMYSAICEALGWDYHTITDDDKVKVAQAVKILIKADYGVDDIRRFMVEIWFKDWRWEKNEQRPTLKQLRQEIGKLRAGVPESVPGSTRGAATSKVARSLSAVDEYYRLKALTDSHEQENEL